MAWTCTAAMGYGKDLRQVVAHCVPPTLGLSSSSQLWFWLCDSISERMGLCQGLGKYNMLFIISSSTAQGPGVLFHCQCCCGCLLHAFFLYLCNSFSISVKNQEFKGIRATCSTCWQQWTWPIKVYCIYFVFSGGKTYAMITWFPFVWVMICCRWWGITYLVWF